MPEPTGTEWNGTLTSINRMRVCARLCDVREWPHAKSEMRYLFIMEIYTICEYGHEYNCEHSLIITFVRLCFFEHFQYVGISFGAPRDCYRHRYCVRAACIIHSSGIADTKHICEGRMFRL